MIKENYAVILIHFVNTLRRSLGARGRVLCSDRAAPREV